MVPAYYLTKRDITVCIIKNKQRTCLIIHSEQNTKILCGFIQKLHIIKKMLIFAKKQINYEN